MDNSNIRIYLIIFGALIILLVLVLIIPFSSKKNTTLNNSINPSNQIFPTSVETNQSPPVNNPSPLIIKAQFTGGINDPLPQPLVDLSNQKKDLRNKTPLFLSTFTIDFDYSEDKFTVTLKDPKDKAEKEFESWRTNNYPALSANQFLIK